MEWVEKYWDKGIAFIFGLGVAWGTTKAVARNHESRLKSLELQVEGMARSCSTNQHECRKELYDELKRLGESHTKTAVDVAFIRGQMEGRKPA